MAFLMTFNAACLKHSAIAQGSKGGFMVIAYSLLLSVFSAAVSVQASELARDPYFQISAPRIEWLGDEASPDQLEHKSDELKSVDGLGEAIVVIDQIIAVGKKIYAIIEAGRPVVNIQTDRVSALPKGTNHWAQFEGWSNPKASVYSVSYSNGFNQDVVKFKFRVVYTYGGRFDGKGRYLANVTVVPMDTYVAWGYTFNAKTSVPEAVNVGTRTNPIAGLELNVNWEVKTVVRDHKDSVAFFIRGDGRILDLTNGN